mmetsp:Transcript_20496/g.48910  ORF Transcript_20496/g.48910 Transcript_20496/m.48910 type:complete len:177 (-) Transcript_20496:191-721(-)
MKLTVQLEDGQFREFIAKSSDTMTEVRRKINETLGVPASRQKLLFGGNQLEDAPTLAHALWDALKKVEGATDSSGSRIDLNKVKQLCSPASSPARGMSPAHSCHKDLNQMDTMSATDRLLAGAASALGSSESPRGARTVSPERRMAALQLVSQYNMALEPEEEEAEIEMGTAKAGP